MGDEASITKSCGKCDHGAQESSVELAVSRDLPEILNLPELVKMSETLSSNALQIQSTWRAAR